MTGSKPLLDRFSSDLGTKLRLKYQPYYHIVQEQEGPYVIVDGKRMLMMSSNEYLGLSAHPESRKPRPRRSGSGGRVRAVPDWPTATGPTTRILRAYLADFLRMEACHVTSAGYLACMAPVSTLVRRNDALLVDKSIPRRALGRRGVERCGHRAF